MRQRQRHSRPKRQLMRLILCLFVTAVALPRSGYGQVVLGNPVTINATGVGAASPQGLTYHPGRDSIFVLSENGRVVELDLDGSVIQSFALDFQVVGGGISYDPVSGNLLVTTELIVYEIGATGGTSSIFLDLSADLIDTQGIVVHPQSGNLWVADDMNDEVAELNRSGGVVSSFDTQDILRAFDEPTGLAFLGGDLLITDDMEGSRKLYLVSTVGALIQEVADTTAFGMNDPEGVAIVGDSHIWLCGDSDDSILILKRLDTNQSPVADAGPDQTVDEATPVVLDGSGSSDPDEDPVTFSWEQLSGPGVALSNPTSAMASFTAPEVSGDTTLIFRLTVSDGQLSAQDQVSILVTNENLPPVADAGPDETVGESTQVTLDGSGSSDPDEDPITFSWEQLSGPNVALSNPTSAMASFTSPEVSEDTTLIFQLTVSDGQLSDQDLVSILVTSENLPPVADAGPDQEVEERAEVFLDGRASSDPNGDAISFQWEQLSGPLVTIVAPRSAVASFIAPRVDAGTVLVFRLKVSDESAESEDQVAITVLPVVITVFFPQVGDGTVLNIRLRSNLIFVNTGLEATLDVDFFDSNGNPLPFTLGDQGTASSFSIPLAAGEAISLETPGSGDIKVGYARVTSDPSVGGTIVFARSELLTGTVLYEAGVPATSPVSDFHLFLDSILHKDTGLAMVYPVPEAAPAQEHEATVTLQLYNTSFQLIDEQTVVFRPGEHRAQFIHELFPAVLEQAREMQGVVVVSSDQPLVAVTLRQNDNPEADFPEEVPTLTTFPVIAPVPKEAAGDQAPVTVYFPQVGDGTVANIRLQSNLIFVNTGLESTLEVDFFDSNGNPLQFTLGDQGTASNFSIPLAAGEAISLETPGSGDLKVGYARVTSDPSVGGTIVFARSDAETGTVLYEAGVPATIPLTDFHLFLDSTLHKDTGVAMVFPVLDAAPAQAHEATVTLQLYDTSFQLVDEETVLLQPGEHRARFVHELFPAVLEQALEMRGVVVVSSDQPLVSVTLRQNDNPAADFPEEVPTLTTFPVIPPIPEN